MEGSPAADPLFGRMNAPTAAAVLRGICGDEIEFYLIITDGAVEDVRYYTDGCEHTRRCAQAVARAVKGRSVHEALGVNPREIIDGDPSLSQDGRHCAILAVSTLYRALADYLLMP